MLKECKAVTEPEASALVLNGYADRLSRVGLEAQSLSPSLYVELREPSLPAIIVEALHMAVGREQGRAVEPAPTRAAHPRALHRDRPGIQPNAQGYATEPALP